ncbi:hypothetical protein OYT1_ch1281 [Ferriphaselus amnicola]|uniref:Uncharacterized protein n=1 Tax=Ferriphaselus amnicola TaxID=1188319 RepID=A0A2Z6GBG7_9PROT|nr:hypothetical protein [Ferriphaselus amnicola]BBE50838.1 hypothetical protein OYT1_ch1281 [Ferriphaselus amnicola]
MKNLDHSAVLRIHPTAVPNKDFYVRIVAEGGLPELVWLSPELPEPSSTELETAIAAEQAVIKTAAYLGQRAAEYPALTDYIDAQVKKASNDPVVQQAGREQEAAYLNACLSIKQKYPKGDKS